MHEPCWRVELPGADFARFAVQRDDRFGARAADGGADVDGALQCLGRIRRRGDGAALGHVLVDERNSALLCIPAFDVDVVPSRRTGAFVAQQSQCLQLHEVARRCSPRGAG